MRQTLDETDRAILNVLQTNGRASYRTIAQILKLPESTVRVRTRKLLSSGLLNVVVTGNPLELGIPVIAISLIRVAPSQASDIAEFLAKLPAVRYAAICLGGNQLITESFHPTSLHLHTYLAEEVPAIPGVQQVDSHQVIDIRKSTWNWNQWLPEASPQTDTSAR